MALTHWSSYTPEDFYTDPYGVGTPNAVTKDAIAAYLPKYQDFMNYVETRGADGDKQAFWNLPETQTRWNQISSDFDALQQASKPTNPDLIASSQFMPSTIDRLRPAMSTGERGGWFSDLIQSVPSAIGSVVGAAAGGPWGAALGGSLLGGIAGGYKGGWGGGLLGALGGGAGGYLSGGGLSEILNGTGDVGSLFSGSDVATSAATPSFTPDLTSAGAAVGGGSPGGFFETLGLPDLSSTFGETLDDTLTPTDFGSGLTGALNPNVNLASTTPSFFDDPINYVTTKATDKVGNMFSTDNLLKGGLKSGLSYFLSKDNEGGYNALQGAANTAAGNYQPFLASGTDANNQLADLSGLNGPEAAAAAMAKYQESPAFRFALDEGIKALDASAASKGMLLSGNHQQAVQKYGSGLASQFFDDYLRRLQTTANAGQTAANGVANNSMNAATAYAMMKKDKADNFNRVIGGLASFL